MRYTYPLTPFPCRETREPVVRGKAFKTLANTRLRRCGSAPPEGCQIQVHQLAVASATWPRGPGLVVSVRWHGESPIFSRGGLADLLDPSRRTSGALRCHHNLFDTDRARRCRTNEMVPMRWLTTTVRLVSPPERFVECSVPDQSRLSTQRAITDRTKDASGRPR